MTKADKSKRAQKNEPGLFIGYQWGDPPTGQRHLLVNRIEDELEITAVMPRYLSETRSCDLLQQYEIARKNRPIAKQRTGKDSPHIRFANADCDDELIDFVRSFGPAVSSSWKDLPSESPLRADSAGDSAFRCLMRARQGLPELRSEQRIYKAALGLVNELTKKETAFDINSAKERMGEIARGIRDWPRQWNRERNERGEDPPWRVPAESIRRIVALINSGRDRILPPQLDARIVLCELVNVFPSLAFPNPLEMHSYMRFGIRPLLYSILRREFLQPRDLGVCANTQCRAFFEIERAGQRFCNEECSRQQRQRDYWQSRGKKARKKRLATRSANQNLNVVVRKNSDR